MMASKGRVPMTIPARPLGTKRLWLASFVSIVAILAVNYIVSGPAHVGSPMVVRLAAARSSPPSSLSPSSSPDREPQP
jgi:hypothetical protein